jgi:hypothetical protein
MLNDYYKAAADRLSYDPLTGALNWIAPPSVRSHLRGKQAGSKYSDGYVYVRYDGRRLLAHRLAWIKLTGVAPDGQIDHINMIRSDNRACNLRLASVAENNRNRTLQSNNTSGYKGVTFHKGTGKYQAKICVNKKRISLGYFSDAESAAQAYQKAVGRHHGQFARSQ